MKTKTNNDVVRYKIYNYDNPDMHINFNINIMPYSEKHRHDFWEIMIMLQDGCINVVNGAASELLEEEIQILRPDDLHYTKKLKTDGYRLLNLEIKTEFFETFLKMFSPSLFENMRECPGVIPKYKLTRNTFEKVFYLMSLAQRFYDEVDEARQFLLKEIVAIVMAEFQESFYTEKINKKADRLFSSMFITLLNQPENICLKLHEVCKKYPCSVEYAIRQFKEEGMAETPNMIFRKIKLGYACSLLKTTNMTIISICEKAGYNNLGFFNRLFRETYGITPKVYRKIYRDAKI
ncbi:MAG: helix-turn-helix domain-containing protein [Clostridia bacterium]|nr:helix-turn-helix domain-containing protein [Clostridia bacterium]